MFDFICAHLAPYIERRRTNYREPISVETWVSVTLYYLSTGGMHFLKVVRDLEIYVFVKDGQPKNAKIVKFVKKITNHHRIVRPDKFLYKSHLGIVLII